MHNRTAKEPLICNIYISPNENISYHDMTDSIVQLPPQFILMGDTNAKCELWGGTTTDPHVRIFEQLLLNMNIGLLNSGAHTHYHARKIHHQQLILACALLSCCLSSHGVLTMTFTVVWWLISPFLIEQGLCFI